MFLGGRGAVYCVLDAKQVVAEEQEQKEQLENSDTGSNYKVPCSLQLTM